jgi:hypothetical protein
MFRSSLLKKIINFSFENSLRNFKSYRKSYACAYQQVYSEQDEPWSGEIGSNFIAR